MSSCISKRYLADWDEVSSLSSHFWGEGTMSTAGPGKQQEKHDFT